MKNSERHLLYSAEKIIAKHDIIEKATGGKFNIFTILERDRSETRHSRLLAELLNPRGLHGQEGTYLKLFYLMFEDEFIERWSCKDHEFDIDEFSNNALLYTEQFHSIDGRQGFIDIVIETNKYAIIIENKIDAGDQTAQLDRYAQSKKGKNVLLIYLTPDGREVSEDSKGSLDSEKIVRISYANHIIKWISAAIKVSVTLPAIRETLVQYEKLLRMITNQNDADMEKEMTDLLLQNDNLKIAQRISNALPLAKATLELEFWKKTNELLLPQLKKYGFKHWNGYQDDEIRDQIVNRYKKGMEFVWFFYPREYKKGKYFYFGVGADQYEKLYIGCYPCDSEGGNWAESDSKESVKLLNNPFGTNKHYRTFGEKRDFYGEGVLVLIDQDIRDELAQDTVNSLEPILISLKNSIDIFFGNST